MATEKAGAGAKGDGEEAKGTPTEPTDTASSFEELTQEQLRARVEAGELAILSKDQVLEADDLVEEFIHVPEWGGVVKIRSFTKGKQQEIDERATVDDEIDPKKVQMFAFLEGVIEPEFDRKDIPKLKERSGAAFDKVITRIFEISALGRDAVEKAEARFREESG